VTEPPSLRIAGELRAQIERGDLAPGERVPSAREITRRWGVAIATATRVLAALRDDGLVRAVPGVGTVVVAPPEPGGSVAGRPRGGAPGSARRAAGAVAGPRRPAAPVGGAGRVGAKRPVGRTGAGGRADAIGEAGPAALGRAERSLGVGRIVGAAVAIADAEGLDGLSMRRVATELGAAPMSLYRHVTDKDDLLLRMMDAALREARLPAVAPPGWRPRLEVAARSLWAAFRRHPWLAPALSLTRPQAVAGGLAYTEWVLAALTDADSVAKGQAIFTSTTSLCSSCHRPDLGGLVGPNLTDDQWLHGCTAAEIVRNITTGFPPRGMLPYGGGPKLTDQQLLQVASFVLSKRGSHPPNPKATDPARDKTCG